MNADGRNAATRTPVAGEGNLGAGGLPGNGVAREADADFAPMVTVLVDMPLGLKRKFHAEAKRRGQSFSEFICARCDFDERAGETNNGNGGKR